MIPSELHRETGTILKKMRFSLMTDLRIHQENKLRKKVVQEQKILKSLDELRDHLDSVLCRDHQESDILNCYYGTIEERP